VAEVIDYKPVALPDDHPGRQTLVRRVEMIRGELPLEMICCPSFDYPRAGHTHEERLDDAQLLFEKMLSYANPLGPFAEETSNRGQVLGNFPQAFIHISLISAAFNLNRPLADRH